MACLFLQLPVELRYMVYDYLVVDAKDIVLKDTEPSTRIVRRSVTATVGPLPEFLSRKAGDGELEYYYESEQHDIRPHPNILRVSRQISAECAPLLYHSPKTFLTPMSLCLFFSQVGRQNFARLKHVGLFVWGEDEDEDDRWQMCAWQDLAHHTNLRTLTLYGCTKPKHQPAVMFAGLLYAYARAFLEETGRRRGRPDAALDILRIPYPEEFLTPSTIRGDGPIPLLEYRRQILSEFFPFVRQLLTTNLTRQRLTTNLTRSTA